MTHSSPVFRVLALAAALAAGAGLMGAQAQVYVLESTADTVKPGTAYKAADRIAFPAGSSIRAVMPSGKTQTIQGPYAGPAADLAKGQRANEGVIAWIMNLVQTGGSNERTPGVTRSMRPAEVPASFSWTAIPSTVDSTFCIEKNAKLELRRAPSQRTERIIVLNPATSERGEAEFAAGSDVASWPAGVALRPDTTYALLASDNRPRKQVTLRVLDRLPADEDLVAELAARDCKHQFDAWVRARTVAGKKAS
jgi:hypothetical protein